MHRVAVLGAAGFAGALAASIVERHPQLELTLVTARSDAGRRLDQIYPRYRVRRELETYRADEVAERADSAIVAYPHGAAAPVVEDLRARGMKVVDLSADFRLSQELYERYYQPHEAPGLIAEAVYGMPELYREQIRDASLVAGPGCNATAAILALRPLRELMRDVVIDIKAGVSGAGREPTGTTHFSSVDENLSPYKVEGHRHRGELEQEISSTVPITFTPHLVPLDQGIMASCYVTPTSDLTGDEVRDIFRAAYADEPFIELADSPPGVREVCDTNFCRIHATVEPATGRVLVFSSLDNLWKGAAGQGVQALNLMLGLDETAGLG